MASPGSQIIVLNALIYILNNNLVQFIIQVSSFLGIINLSLLLIIFIII